MPHTCVLPIMHAVHVGTKIMCIMVWLPAGTGAAFRRVMVSVGVSGAKRPQHCHPTSIALPATCNSMQSQW